MAVPHDLSAEMAVLGCLITDPSRIDQALELDLDVDDFYRPAHKNAWQTIVDLSAAGKPIDVIIVAGLVDGLDASDVAAWYPVNGNSANVGEYIAVLKAVTDRRKMFTEGHRLIADAGGVIGSSDPTDDTTDDTGSASHAAGFGSGVTGVIGVNGGVAGDAFGDVLDELVAFMGRYMVMTAEQFDAVALWVAHTHAVEHFDVCAYLHVFSADKRCGKSLLLDLLEQLVLRGVSTANISPAALYRMIDAQHPTLLFDEIDNIFTKGKNADPSMTALTGLVNAGFRKGRVAYRMGGANMRELEEFDPFGPKALAGIGSCLPDTTADRAIPVKLERKGRGQTKVRYRIRVHENEAQALGERVAAAVGALSGLGERWPELPDELNDRQQDIWEPLLALADAAGGSWPVRARDAAKALHSANDQAESVMTKLLVDIRAIYEPRDPEGQPLVFVEKMLTKELAAKLNDLEESPWGDWRAGQGISAAQIAVRLRDYGIRSKPMRVGADRGKGFEYDQLSEVFSRYLTVDTDDSDDTASKNPATTPNTPVITPSNPTDDTPLTSTPGASR